MFNHDLYLFNHDLYMFNHKKLTYNLPQSYKLKNLKSYFLLAVLSLIFPIKSGSVGKKNTHFLQK